MAKQYPSKQPFNKQQATAASNERKANKVVPKNLARRQKDYEVLLSTSKGNLSGFHRPGSNKK